MGQPTPPPGAEPAALPAAARPSVRRRPLKAVVQVVRRLHLFAGLLMLPWVLLYGVTAFLFNHPAAFPDQPTTEFGADALADTPMQSPPPPAAVAARVVAALQARAPAGTTYALADPGSARYTREFAFATVKAGDRELNVLVDVTGAGGTVRTRPAAPPKAAEERAPFAVGGESRGGGRGRAGGGGRGADRGEARRGGDALKLDDPLPDRVAAAVPRVLERAGLPGGDVTVTSVPDLTFRMTAGDGGTWDVTYNAKDGTVSGKLTAAPEGNDLSARRFITRLHLTHGYPGDVNAKWAWAVAVDVMAGVMVFWGLSGLVMWLQIKATRWYGAAALAVSAAAAGWVGFAMYDMLTAAR